MRRVLIVEDDPDIVELLTHYLERDGWHVDSTTDGTSGLDRLRANRYQLLILDLQLPRLDGLSVCREARRDRRTGDIPIIMLTARGEETDRVVGLELGADDYIVKPFSLRELLARVEAVLRRSPERPLDVEEIRLPTGLADLARCEVRFDDGTRCELSELERDVLRYLAANPDRVISRDELLSRVWRVAWQGVETRTIDMHVARLREKLRDDATQPRVIVTVRGQGYKLALDVTRP